MVGGFRVKESLDELNRRVTKAGEDLKDTYNQLRRGGAPEASAEATNSISSNIPGLPGDPRFKPTEPFRKAPSLIQESNQFELRIPEVTEVTPQEALEIVVNEPAIRITPELMEVINDPLMMMTRNGELARRMTDQKSSQFELQDVLPIKKKRKVSKYQKEFGRQLKTLKKKFPRTKIQNLMKRAHAATRKALKNKR